MKLKKVLSGALCAIMLLSIMSISVFADATTHEVATYEQLTNAIADAQAGDIIEITSDFPASAVIDVTKSLTINGNNHTISSSANRMLWISASDVTLNLNDLTLQGDGAHTERGVQINNNLTNVTFNITNCTVTGVTYYAFNITICESVTINASKSQFDGWCGFQTWSNGYTATFDECIFNGINDKPLDAWNSFATFVIEGDTTNQTTQGAGNNTLTLNNCTINSISTSGNYQYAIGFNSHSNSNTINITGENTVVNYSNETFYYDNGENNVLNITAGTFSSDITLYLPSGYYAKENASGTYTVTPAAAEVIETSKTTNATVTLYGLRTQDEVDLDEDATYKVVVATAPADDAQKATAKIAENGEADKEKAIFDISVMKTDSNGTEKDISGNITNQFVAIELGETPETDSVSVYHVDNVNNTVDAISGVVVSDNVVMFIAPSFSTYAVTYTAAAVDDDAITKEIEVAFEEAAEGEYDIVLRAADGLKINRFMSATIAFALDATNIAYEIEPAANITVEEVKENVFRFNMDGINAAYASGTAINIGKVYFTGYGHLEFKVDNTKTFDGANDIAVNIVNTAKAADNIVDKYTPLGDASATPAIPELKINDDVTNNEGVIDTTLAKNTKNLTINVKFNNIISDNEAAYQDMKVTVSGGDLTSPIVKNFGSDGEITLNGDTYTVEIADTLTQNVNYSVKVEGAGYRTARHTVTMTENKVLNFWNNVKDSVNATVIEIGKTPMTKNFLAGDIVKDNNINIYDLSAVVSYFGTENLVSVHPEYAKYDLNRDGVIDSKDVAYVLVSWGE
jgi:hypothetical protein